MKSDTTRSIFLSAKSFFSGTLISRITGLGRDVSMAFVFGSHPSVAALMVAFRLSNLFRRLFGEGALHVAFVPHFEEERVQSQKNAAYFYRDLSLSLSVILLLLTLLSECVVIGSLSFFQLSSNSREILFLTAILLPGVFFICHAALNCSLLQCEKYFFIPAISPVAFNLIWILGVYLLHDFEEEKAIPLLAIIIVLGFVLQWVMTVPLSLKFLYKYLDRNFFLKIKEGFKNLFIIIKPLSLGLIGVGATQINSALDPLFARFSDAEGPAYLWYSIRLQQAPLAFFGIALAGAILPALSRCFKNQEYEKYHELLIYALKKCSGLLVPVTFALIVVGGSSINLIYGRGNFSQDSAYYTTICLMSYALGLLPQALVILLSPAFYAQKNYSVTTIATISSVLLNVVLNSLFIFGFNMGSYSVAIATSICAWVNCIILFFIIQRKFKKDFKPFYQEFYRICLMALSASLVVLLIGYPVLEDYYLSWQKEFFYFPRLFTSQIVHFGFQAVVFLSILFLISWVFKVEFIFDRKKVK